MTDSDVTLRENWFEKVMMRTFSIDEPQLNVSSEATRVVVHDRLRVPERLQQRVHLHTIRSRYMRCSKVTVKVVVKLSQT